MLTLLSCSFISVMSIFGHHPTDASVLRIHAAAPPHANSSSEPPRPPTTSHDPERVRTKESRLRASPEAFQTWFLILESCLGAQKMSLLLSRTDLFCDARRLLVSQPPSSLLHMQTCPISLTFCSMPSAKPSSRRKSCSSRKFPSLPSGISPSCNAH